MKRRKNDEDRNRDGEVATSGSTVAPASVSLPLLVDGASRPKLGQVLVDQQLLSPEALTAALNSPVRHEMREDFKHFPPFTGPVTHFPMRTRRVA